MNTLGFEFFLFITIITFVHTFVCKHHLNVFTNTFKQKLLEQTPPSCYKFTVNHGFTGLIAFIKRLFYIHSKVSQNKIKQIKCNDFNKNIILPPNNVVPQKRLWLQQSGYVCRVIYNNFLRGLTNQNHGSELSVLLRVFLKPKRELVGHHAQIIKIGQRGRMWVELRCLVSETTPS